MARKKLVIHHRKPCSIGGTNEPRNRSQVTNQKHIAWHILFANKDVNGIATEINKFYCDPDYVFVPVHRDNGISLGELSNIVKDQTDYFDG